MIVGVEAMGAAFVVAVITAMVTGYFSSIVTVRALQIHIGYIKKTQSKHETMIDLAHRRIDEIQGVHNGRH